MGSSFDLVETCILPSQENRNNAIKIKVIVFIVFIYNNTTFVSPNQLWF